MYNDVKFKTWRRIIQIKDNIVKGVRNFSRLEKGNKTIKDRTIRDIRNLSEDEEEDC